MKKLKNFLRSRSKSRGSGGSVSLSAIEFDEAEIKSMPSIHQAIIDGDVDKVKKLMKNDINVQDSCMRTPLFIACHCQEWDIATMLLDAKCQVDLHDKNGNTPLMKAVEAKNSRIAMFGIAQANQFVSYGANVLRVNSENRSCFHFLAMSKCGDKTAIFNSLLNSRKSKKERQRVQDLQDKDRLSALHLSVMADNVEICQALIANGANVNLADNQGRTPLMLSCSSGNEEICKALLAANADLHPRDTKGRTALTLARESSTQKCVALIEEYRSLHPSAAASSSEQSQSWEDATEAESDEAEEVDEDLSTTDDASPSPIVHAEPAKPTKSVAATEIDSKSPSPPNVIKVSSVKAESNNNNNDTNGRVYTPADLKASPIDDVSTSSEEPVFGTVRFKDGESPRPKLQTSSQASPGPVLVKPAISVSSPRTSLSSNVASSKQSQGSPVSSAKQPSLLKALTKSNDSADEMIEPEFNYSGSGDPRSSLNRSGNGNRLGHSFDMTSDVVKTSLDSVTSGMTTEWDSATEQSGAYPAPHNQRPVIEKDVGRTDDDDDDWSEGPALSFPVNTTHPLNITISTPADPSRRGADDAKKDFGGGGVDQGNQLSSLVAQSVRRVIVGVGEEETTTLDTDAAAKRESSLHGATKNGGATMYDDSDLSEIALSNSQSHHHNTNNNNNHNNHHLNNSGGNNRRTAGDSLKQTQPIDDDLHASRHGYMPSQTSVSQASSRWDTDDNSLEFGGSGHRIISPTRAHAKLADDDTDVSSDVDDDDRADVAAEMGRYLEGSLVGEGGNWLGPTKERDRSHLPPMREITTITTSTTVTATNATSPKGVIVSVGESEPISKSRRSSTSSLNQQNPADWLGIEQEIPEYKVRKSSPISVIAVAELATAVDDHSPTAKQSTEAFAGASEISMPSPPSLASFGLTGTTQNVGEGRGRSFAVEDDADSISPVETIVKPAPTTTAKSVPSPRIQSHHITESQQLVHSSKRSEFSPTFSRKSDNDDVDIHELMSNDGDAEVQPMIDNLFTLSGSITDTFQLTKVQDAIRQLSTRCHGDERRIASLQTENKMLRDDVTLLEQKLEHVNAAKSLAERSYAQLELKISSLEAEQVSDARKSSSSTERLRIQLQETEVKVAMLQDENKKLERDRNHLEAKLVSVEGLLKQVEGERDFAKQQHALQQQQLMAVSTSNRDELRSEIARLMDENAKFNTRLDDSARLQKRTESELDAARSELVNVRASLRIAEQRIEEAQRTADNQSKRFTEDTIKKDAEMVRLNENVRNLSTQLEAAKGNVLRLEGDLATASRAASDRAQQLQTATDEARLAKIEVNTEREHARKLELKNESLEQRMLDTERRLNDLQRQLDDANHALTIANRRASGATEMYATGPSPVDTRSLSLLEMRCHELLETKSRIGEDLVRMEAAKKAAEQEAKHATTRLTDAEKRAAQLEASLETTQRALEDANRRADRAGDDNRRAQTELAERNAEVDRLRRELSAFHEAASDLVGRSNTAATISELRTRLKVAEDELKVKESELVEIRQKFEVRDQLSNAEMTKLKTIADDARQLWEQEVKTKAGVGQLLLEAERRRDVAENESLLAKNENHRLEDQLRLAERRMEDERNRFVELEAKLGKTKAKIAELKVKLVGAQGYDDKLADLSRQIDQQRIGYDERINLLKKQLEDARKEVETERSMRDRIESERQSLQVRIARVASLEAQVNELLRQKAIIDADFSQYRDAISRTHIERSVMDFKLQEAEAKLRAEYDTKIKQFHLSLTDLDREREMTDELRHANQQAKDVLFNMEKEQLIDEVSRLRSAYNSLTTGVEIMTSQQQGDQPPMTSTPIAASEPPSLLMSPTHAVDNTATQQTVNRRLTFERLQPVLGSEHLSKILSGQLSRQPHSSSLLSTSLITSRVLNNSSMGRMPASSLSYNHPRGCNVMSASFHYSMPSSSAYRSSRRDFSIENLRSQLDRAVAIGLSGRPYTAGHSMI